jgi:hypothetical protein
MKTKKYIKVISHLETSTISAGFSTLACGLNAFHRHLYNIGFWVAFVKTFLAGSGDPPTA